MVLLGLGINAPVQARASQVPSSSSSSSPSFHLSRSAGNDTERETQTTTSAPGARLAARRAAPFAARSPGESRQRSLPAATAAKPSPTLFPPPCLRLLPDIPQAWGPSCQRCPLLQPSRPHKAQAWQPAPPQPRPSSCLSVRFPAVRGTPGGTPNQPPHCRVHHTPLCVPTFPPQGTGVLPSTAHPPPLPPRAATSAPRDPPVPAPAPSAPVLPLRCPPSLHFQSSAQNASPPSSPASPALPH